MSQSETPIIDKKKVTPAIIRGIAQNPSTYSVHSNASYKWLLRCATRIEQLETALAAAQEAGKFLASERERLIGEARDAQERIAQVEREWQFDNEAWARDSARLRAAESRCAELQAKIDALMLEYCPQEMTQEQVDNWMAAQARVSPEDEARINAALAKEAK
ncbi:MAG: hypothetical protein ACM3SS_06905 [Rhodospirillaceae bacterium]